MSLDLDHFRTELEDELDRLRAARKGVNHESSVMEETGDLSSGAGELADSATETYMRELDEGLEENADHLIVEVEAALVRIDDGTFGTCAVCGNLVRAAGREPLERDTFYNVKDTISV